MVYVRRLFSPNCCFRKDVFFLVPFKMTRQRETWSHSVHLDGSMEVSSRFYRGEDEMQKAGSRRGQMGDVTVWSRGRGPGGSDPVWKGSSVHRAAKAPPSGTGMMGGASDGTGRVEGSQSLRDCPPFQHCPKPPSGSIIRQKDRTP